MVGTAENPVRLWPYSRIIEVGWGVRWLALSLTITKTASNFDGQTTTTEPSGGLPEFHNWFYTTDVPLSVTTDLFKRVNQPGGTYIWEDAGNDFSVSGLFFETQTETFDPYAWNHGAGGTGSQSPRIVHVPGTEQGDSPMNAPGSVPFDRGLDTSAYLEGQAFTGEPIFPVNLNPPNYPLAAEFDPAMVHIADYPFSVSGVTVTFKGKTYSAVRTTNSASSFVVLMEREQPTA